MNNWRELKIMMKALADVVRLTIVYHLARNDEITVMDLTDLLGLSQPLVSWHLRKLRHANLISTRRVGRQVYCSLDTNRFEQCLQRLKNLVDPSSIVESIPLGSSWIEAEVALED